MVEEEVRHEVLRIDAAVGIADGIDAAVDKDAADIEAHCGREWVVRMRNFEEEEGLGIFGLEDALDTTFD